MENTARGVATIRKEARGGSRPARISVVSRLLNHFVSHEIGRHETFVTQCVSACVSAGLLGKLGKFLVAVAPSSHAPSPSPGRASLPSMGKLKNYDCHKQKYYVPQTKPKWAVLNLKQAAKKVDKEKSAAKKQTLGKKAKIALKLANRKGGRARDPANPDFQKNLQRVRGASRVPRPASTNGGVLRRFRVPRDFFSGWRRRRSTTRAKYLPPPPSPPAPLPPRPDPSTLPLPPVRRRRTSRRPSAPAGRAAAATDWRPTRALPPRTRPAGRAPVLDAPHARARGAYRARGDPPGPTGERNRERRPPQRGPSSDLPGRPPVRRARRGPPPRGGVRGRGGARPRSRGVPRAVAGCDGG